jgi:hypothetical protein
MLSRVTPVILQMICVLACEMRETLKVKVLETHSLVAVERSTQDEMKSENENWIGEKQQSFVQSQETTMSLWLSLSKQDLTCQLLK